MENWLMLTLAGKDRPGIVAETTHAYGLHSGKENHCTGKASTGMR